jgi:hypothetical protein
MVMNGGKRRAEKTAVNKVRSSKRFDGVTKVGNSVMNAWSAITRGDERGIGTVNGGSSKRGGKMMATMTKQRRGYNQGSEAVTINWGMIDQDVRRRSGGRIRAKTEI